MYADITKLTDGSKIRQNRKEDKLMYGYKVITSDFKEIVDLRIYGTSSKNYACIWVRGKNGYGSGGGSAGGYGYHRPSQAVENALEDAGIALYTDGHKKKIEYVGGRGDSVIEDALKAIAKSITSRKTGLVKFYG